MEKDEAEATENRERVKQDQFCTEIKFNYSEKNLICLFLLIEDGTLDRLFGIRES